MIIVLITIILIIGIAIVGSLYSNFMVFYTLFSETQNYNKAYYASISALERAELVIRHRYPGYQGEGGRKGTTNVEGNTHKDNKPDPNQFSYFSTGNSNNTSILRKITSLTNRIPSTGQGNVDPLLSANDSENYNKMDYESAEIFLMYRDAGELDAYTTGPKSYINTTAPISGQIRLPGKLKATFGNLDDEHALIGAVKNDAIVDRQIKGFTNTNTNYTIYSSQKTDSNGNISTEKDSAIRESTINNTCNLNFNINNKNPIRGGSNVSLNIISKSGDSLQNKSLSYFFENTKVEHIRLALLNLLHTQTDSNSRKNSPIYPFLEYYMDFGDTKIPDKYYTIDAEGEFGNFQVNTIILKPTTHETTFGNFTVIL